MAGAKFETLITEFSRTANFDWVVGAGLGTTYLVHMFSIISTIICGLIPAKAPRGSKRAWAYEKRAAIVPSIGVLVRSIGVLLCGS